MDCSCVIDTTVDPTIFAVDRFSGCFSVFFTWFAKEATDTLRNDHAQIPRLAPGLNVADPRVSLEIAQAGLDSLQSTVSLFWTSAVC